MEQNRSYFDLIDALTQDGCAICRSINERIDRQIDTLNYECVMDPGVRKVVKDGAGFCSDHAHRWQQSASVLATAQIYVDILQRAETELATVSFQKRRPFSDLRSRMASRNRRLPMETGIEVLSVKSACLICIESAEVEAHFVKVLAGSAGDERFGAALRSGTVCVPHAKVAMAIAKDTNSFDAIKDSVVASNRELLVQLREIVRKNDHRFNAEPGGDEVGAGKRAVRLVAGEPGL